MSRISAVFLVLALILGACGSGSVETTTTTSPTTSDPVATTTPVTTSPPPTTAPPRDSSTWDLPIDEDWTTIHTRWGVTPSGGDLPALGPVSPEIAFPLDSPPEDGLAGLEDGFYDVTVSRVADPPGVLVMAVRRWVSCDDIPGKCIFDAPADGVVADPATEVERIVFMDEQLTVFIRPLSDPAELSDPPLVVTGSGAALYQLLSGWCEGYLDSPLTTNCGLDHAFTDWMWEPSRAGANLAEIDSQIRAAGSDPNFPLRALVHEPGLPDCPPNRGCLIAYRGPQGSNLVLGSWLAEVEHWPGYSLYDWWTSLEIRDGRPILYIDTAQIAG